LDKNAQTAIRISVNRNYGFEPSGEAVYDVAGLVGAAKQMHPVKEYLRAQSWDGVERLNSLMTRGFGCLPSETQSQQYLEDVGRKLCISLVARVMDPQAKNEVVVIAQGKQGKGKSTAFAALCPKKEWHSDSHLKLSDKDAYMALQGKWLYEIAELSSFKKSEQDAIKAFISSLCDNFRPPYSPFTVQQYRNTVFVASTNDDQFLDDPTGDRRWAPVTSGVIDLTWIRGNVNQLWAEAVVRYDGGERWWYEGEEETRRARACKPFKVEDAWNDVILHKLFEGSNDGFYTVDRILTRWLNVPVERLSKMEKNRLTRVMTQLGLPYVPENEKRKRTSLKRRTKHENFSVRLSESNLDLSDLPPTVVLPKHPRHPSPTKAFGGPRGSGP
jgi:putative DNA primase/helicase